MSKKEIIHELKQKRINLNKYFLLSLVIIVFVSSCVEEKQSLYSKLKGQWAINELKYDGLSYKEQLYSNVLIFRDNGVISIPRSAHFEKDRKATWELINENNRTMLVLKTFNKVFKDTFEVRFRKNKEKQLIELILKSDTISINSYKLLQNYNRW